MELQHLVMLAVQASILLTVFGFGLQATTGDVLYVVRAPACLARSLAAMFLVMPLAAVALVRAFEFLPSVEIALVALALSPVPPLLLKRERKAGGHASYGLGLMAVVSLLSIVLVPLAVELVGRYASRPFGMAPIAVARIALTSALLPLVAGMAFRVVLPSVAQGIARPVALVATILLSAGALAILGTSLPAMMALVGNGTILAMAAFVAAGLIAGHLLGGPAPDEKIVLALATACRHPGIALAIGAANYPEQRLAPTILLYLVVNAIICIPYTMWQRRQMTRLNPS